MKGYKQLVAGSQRMPQRSVRAPAAFNVLRTGAPARARFAAAPPSLLAHKRRPHPALAATWNTVDVRRFASASSSTRNEATKKSPVPSEDFDALKKFLMAPVVHGDAARDAKSLVATMMQRHVYADMSGQEAAVMSMVADAMEDYPFVVEVYQCLRRARVAPSPMTLELTAEACAQTGDWETAHDVIEQMHRAVDLMHPSIEIYENAVRACHRARKWMRGKQLLEAIRRDGLEASPDIHLQVIETCITSKELTATMTLLQEFFREFPALEFDEVRDMLEGLLGMALEHGILDHGLFFREQLASRNMPLPRETYEQLIKLSAQQGKWHSARVLLAQLTKAPSLPVAPPSYKFTQDVERLLEDMPRHEIEIPMAVYNSALRAYGGQTKHQKAVKLLETMKARGAVPDTTSYAAVICSCGSDVQASQRYFDELQQVGLPMSMDAYHVYLLAPSRAQAWETVLERYESISRGASPDELHQMHLDPRIQSCVAIAYSHLGNHDEMLRVFTNMKIHGLVPNLYVYAAAMNAYIANGQWRHALMLFDHMWQEDLDKERLAQFPLIWDAAVTAAIAGEDTERLNDLYSQIITLRGQVRPHIAAKLIENMTSIPTETIWSAFKSLKYLHETHFDSSKRSWQVVNAILMRAVRERDALLAENIIQGAERSLHMRKFNPMTYSLMLELYAHQRSHDKFVAWCSKMAKHYATGTVYTTRAVLLHLRSLTEQNSDEDDFHSLAEAVAELTAAEEIKEFDTPADLGRRILSAVERQGQEVDMGSLVHYVGMCRTEKDLAPIFDRLDSSEGVQVTAHFVQALFLAVAENAPGLQPRLHTFLKTCMNTQGKEIALAALAAFCSTSSPTEATHLLRSLLEHGHDVDDEQLVLFLACCSSNTLEGTPEQPSTIVSVHGIREMCSLVDEFDLPIGAGSVTLLLQSFFALSRGDCQGSEAFEAIETVKAIVGDALEGSSRDELRSFLEEIATDPRDLAYVDQILALL